MKNILTNTPVCRPLKDKLERILWHHPADAAYTLVLLTKLEGSTLKDWFAQGTDEHAHERLCTFLKVPAEQMDSITFGEACALMAQYEDDLCPSVSGKPHAQSAPTNMFIENDIALDDYEAIEELYDQYDPQSELSLDDENDIFEYYCRLMASPLHRISEDLDDIDKAIERWEKKANRTRYPYGAYKDVYDSYENLFSLSMCDYLEAVNLILQQSGYPTLDITKMKEQSFNVTRNVQNSTRVADAFCTLDHESEYGRGWFRLLIQPMDAFRTFAGFGSPQV